MTRKDYRAIAEALNECKPKENGKELIIWRVAVDALTVVCRRDNERFREDLFKQACEGVIAPR